MSEPIISVESLSKCYRLGGGTGGGGYRTLRESIQEGTRRVFNRSASETKGYAGREEFWALRDVSFSVQRGEIVGIIGRNGAGKSTLLKILSRITEPTQGRVTLRGRVASLLEVGTGFHPELTGRENIFLNGAVLGMGRHEIKRKFDEIVAFAEVERFLDTPVKRYSSGMYVRLAFAVAAHLEPEILIVDEVLAVGDAEFQKKCLGKMESVAKGEGRTVLFVSHNMGAVRGLCSRGLLMQGGHLLIDDSAERALDAYLTTGNTARSEFVWNDTHRFANERIKLVRAYVLDEQNQMVGSVACADDFTICLEYKVVAEIPNLRIGFAMQNSEGVQVCGSNDGATSEGTVAKPGVYTNYCRFPGRILNAGSYRCCFGADTPGLSYPVIITEYCLSLQIEDHEGHGPRHEPLPGIVRPTLSWGRRVETSEVACPAAPTNRKVPVATYE